MKLLLVFKLTLITFEFILLSSGIWEGFGISKYPFKRVLCTSYIYSKRWKVVYLGKLIGSTIKTEIAGRRIVSALITKINNHDFYL